MLWYHFRQYKICISVYRYWVVPFVNFNFIHFFIHFAHVPHSLSLLFPFIYHSTAALCAHRRVDVHAHNEEEKTVFKYIKERCNWCDRYSFDLYIRSHSVNSACSLNYLIFTCIYKFLNNGTIPKWVRFLVEKFRLMWSSAWPN